jgi:hypothetical protein
MRRTLLSQLICGFCGRPLSQVGGLQFTETVLSTRLVCRICAERMERLEFVHRRLHRLQRASLQDVSESVLSVAPRSLGPGLNSRVTPPAPTSAVIVRAPGAAR